MCLSWRYLISRWPSNSVQSQRCEQLRKVPRSPVWGSSVLHEWEDCRKPCTILCRPYACHQLQETQLARRGMALSERHCCLSGITRYLFSSGRLAKVLSVWFSFMMGAGRGIDWISGSIDPQYTNSIPSIRWRIIPSRHFSTAFAWHCPLAPRDRTKIQHC